jgi:hypothetical protein
MLGVYEKMNVVSQQSTMLHPHFVNLYSILNLGMHCLSHDSNALKCLEEVKDDNSFVDDYVQALHPTGPVVQAQDCESWVMGLIPTQWTGMLYQYVVSWLKLLPVHKVWQTLLADGKMVLHIPISGVCV